MSIINRFAAIFLTGVVLANCATPAKDIHPSYISPIVYEKYTCDQLGAEAARLSTRATQIVGVQNKKAKNDAVASGVAVVLFWPAVFFIKGNGGATEAEVARLKGEMETVEKVAIQKDCGLVFERPEAVDQ